MTSQIKESENYIWSRNDYVGEEATGKVYKGRHKKKGLHRFIKVFNCKNPELAEREFEVLKKLNHKNVIKLWALEKDVYSGDFVMIMEHCDGGSLLSMLDQPENIYGMPERDFLCLLFDIASGLKHLRDHDIIHRSIKPKNIQYQMEEGCLVFKLNDFGTARHLGTGVFNSFYGEPEYQCPEVFERAVLKRESTKPFSASMDLWSVGVTLYQAATGQLPFQPYGGAQKNVYMYQMMSQKTSGCISASQNSNDGPIEWSQTLPETCNLSLGLQNLICPLLAALLDSKPDKIMTFEAFFNQVTTISKKLAILVYNLCDFILLHIYCDPDISLSEFRHLVTQQTDVAVTSQRLYYENHLLTDWIKVSSFPSTSPSNPIFLFPTDQQSTKVNKFSPKLPKCPQVVMQGSPTDDFLVAKRFSAQHRYLRRLAIDLHLKQQLLQKAAKTFQVVLSQDVSEVKSQMEQFVILLMTEFDQRMSLISQTQSIIWQILNPLKKQPLEIDRKLDQHRQSAIQIGKEVEEMRSELRRLIEEINTFVSSSSVATSSCHDDQNNCLQRMDALICATDEIANEFANWPKLDENQRHIHLVQKRKLEDIFSKGLQWFQENCIPNSKQIYKQTIDWYSQGQNVSQEMEKIKVKASSAVETLKLLTKNVDELQSEMNMEWLKLCHEAKVQLLLQPNTLMCRHQQEVSRHKVIGGEFVFRVGKNLLKRLDRVISLEQPESSELQETFDTSNSHPERTDSPKTRVADFLETCAVYKTLDEQQTLTE